jgi:hypothetical protein
VTPRFTDMRLTGRNADDALRIRVDRAEAENERLLNMVGQAAEEIERLRLRMFQANAEAERMREGLSRIRDGTWNGGVPSRKFMSAREYAAKVLREAEAAEGK